MLAKQVSRRCTSLVGPEPETTSWQARFVQLLPRIRAQAQSRFRHLAPEAREEATAEVIASALVSYARLVALGQEDRAYATTLTRFAVAQFRVGRRVGSRLNGHDVMSAYCQRRKGIMVEQLDHFDERSGDWQELVVEDRHSTPAQVATTRVDFGEWLETLPKRTRRVAETLATGEATGCVARMFGLTPARISQLRRELFDTWCVFTGEAAAASSYAGTSQH
jgi:hypothetical protein